MQKNFGELAGDILQQIFSRPARYRTPMDAIASVEELLVFKIQDFLPSRIGAFEESFVIGLCVASGWALHNRDLLKNEEAFKDNLWAIWDNGMKYFYQNHTRLNPGNRQSMEQVICQGFVEGVSVGKKIKELSVYSKMSTEKVLETLETIKNDPARATHILSSRFKNTPRNERNDR